EFQRVRLPMGAGLGGLVAQTSTPYATTDYFADERFNHTDGIDSAVRDEGLVSILGVPLLLGSQVIGVLYAADRRRRPFAREDVALLSSLAAHAAIALDNARLLTETRTALHELEVANAQLRDTTASMRLAADAHDRLTEVVLRGGGVDDVANELAEVLDGEILVVDPDLRLLSGPDPGASALADDTLLREHAAQAAGTGRTAGNDSRLVVPVMAGAECLGFVLLVPTSAVSGASRRILERGAIVTALLLLFRRTVAEAESRSHRELLDDLLTGDRHDPVSLRERATSLGADLSQPQAVIVVDAGDPRPGLIDSATFLASAQGGLVSRVDGRLVFLLPSADAAAAARTVRADLSRTLNRAVTAGAAPAGTDLETIPTAYADATRCVEALLSLGRVGDAAALADLGFFGALVGGSGDIAGFVAATLRPVLDYDARRGTDLAGTLDAYFVHGGNLSRTSEALHVHTNTVSQRLARITQLLGEAWQEPERALEVHLALRLRALARPQD
ncbi:MAG: helix-turn-helix domain-containing protein, partial [Jiangellaceae bacterium]